MLANQVLLCSDETVIVTLWPISRLTTLVHRSVNDCSLSLFLILRRLYINKSVVLITGGGCFRRRWSSRVRLSQQDRRILWRWSLLWHVPLLQGWCHVFDWLNEIYSIFIQADGNRFTFACPADSYFNQESIACERMVDHQRECRNHTGDTLVSLFSSTTLVPPTNYVESPITTTTASNNISTSTTTTTTTTTELPFRINPIIKSNLTNNNNSKPLVKPPLANLTEKFVPKPEVPKLSIDSGIKNIDIMTNEDDVHSLFNQFDMSSSDFQPYMWPQPESDMTRQPSIQSSPQEDHEHINHSSTDARQSLSVSIQRFLRDNVQLPSHFIRMVPRFWRHLQSSLLRTENNLNNKPSMIGQDSNIVPVWNKPSTRLQQRFEEQKSMATENDNDNDDENKLAGLSTLSIPVLIPINLTREDYRQNMATSLLKPIVIPLKDRGKLVPAYVLRFNQHRLKKRSSVPGASGKDENNNKAAGSGHKKLLPKLTLRSSLLTSLIPPLLRNKLTKSMMAKQKPESTDKTPASKSNDASLMMMAAALANNNAFLPLSVYGPWWTPESYTFIQQQLLKAAESSNHPVFENGNAAYLPSSYYTKVTGKEQAHPTTYPTTKQLFKTGKSLRSANITTSSLSRPKTINRKNHATISTNANVYVPDELFDDHQALTDSRQQQRNKNHESSGHRPNNRDMAIVNGTTLSIVAKKTNDHRGKSPPDDRFTSTVSASMMVGRFTAPNMTEASTTLNRDYESESKLIESSSSNHRRRIKWMNAQLWTIYWEFPCTYQVTFLLCLSIDLVDSIDYAWVII